MLDWNSVFPVFLDTQVVGLFVHDGRKKYDNVRTDVVVADENEVESEVAHVDNSHFDNHVNSYFILIGRL